jgi:mRNA-decapping enzyme subunit 2
LVQGYPASTSWSFPKGKKESGETDVSAAVREVYEEVGFNINELIKEDRYLDKHYNHKSSQNSSTASVTTTSDGPYARMYIIPGISEDEHFEPKARKEIRRIQWHNISDIPTCRYDEVTKTHIKGSNKFFLIISFMKPLKDWIYKYKNKKYGQFRTPSPRRRNGHTHSTSKLKRVPMLEKFNAHSSNFHLTNSSERSTQLTSTGVSHTHLAPPTIAYTPGNTHLATAHGHTPSIIHSSIPIISHAYFSAPVTRIHSSEQTNSPYDSFVKQLMGHAHHTHRKPLPQPLKLEPLLNNVHYPRHLSHSPRSPSTVVTLQPSMIFCNFQFNKHLILQAYNNSSSIS